MSRQRVEPGSVVYVLTADDVEQMAMAWLRERHPEVAAAGIHINVLVSADESRIVVGPPAKAVR